MDIKKKERKEVPDLGIETERSSTKRTLAATD
jgi:hypothetical protein